MTAHISHAPKDYICPICLGVKGIENEHTLIKQTDIIYKDKSVTALINSFFIKVNEGHVIVVPNEHFENIYTLDKAIGRHIFDTTQKVAKAMKKAYDCGGITTRQNNEPVGDQHAFHFHLHIFPRYEGDNFKPADKFLASPEERAVYAQKLRTILKDES